ncbi:MAG: non-ribosomal peptide synthetase, partial [Algicola sp.]|nr:non-ribosomal peptide synthetase [Algicola sp.]
SGEALPLNLAKDFVNQCPKVQLHNLYGPTEAAIDVSHFSCNNGLDGLSSIPIGRPIQNIQLYVLNKQADLVPSGAAGELYIGGVGLARGYLNRAELTQAQFITNPFYDPANELGSKRLYKTGDLVRWLPDGELAFLGRLDHQVKIHGFRIELGEIETALAAHESVKDVVVTAADAPSGDKRLVAYVVGDRVMGALDDDPTAAELEAQQSFSAQLRQYLSDSLPAHMVPSVFVLLDQLPLTANGKLDRRALPEPDIANQQATYVAPTNDIESVLCEVWQAVLAVERVGITDNFFQLGGHSLLAIKLVGIINKRLSCAIGVADMFHQVTVAQQALYIEQSKQNDDDNQHLIIENLEMLKTDEIEEFDL